MKAQKSVEGRGRRRVLFGAAIGTLLGIGLGLALLLPAGAAGTGSVDEQIRALDQQYAEKASAIPEGPGRSTELTALNDQYEVDFAKIGGEAPNGSPSDPPPGDSEPNLVPTGIHNAEENPPGYVLTNYWSQESPNGGTIFIGSGSVQGESKVGGVYVADDAGEHFYPSPNADGPLTIKDVSGSVVTLTSEAGSEVQFDYRSRDFTEG